MAEMLKGKRHGIVQKIDTPLITKEEIKKAMTNEFLLNNHEHHVIHSDGTATVDVTSRPMSKINELGLAYQRGSTLKISGMENWNQAMRDRAHELGFNTTIHLFLSPDKGSAFGYHADDNAVLVHMQYGKKTFYVWDEEEYVYHLEPGDVLYIARQVLHKAITDGPSCHLSIGLEDPVVTSERFASFPVDFDLGDL
jgi:ribosomal protein L16 Arg81 hydroxylase